MMPPILSATFIWLPKWWSCSYADRRAEHGRYGRRAGVLIDLPALRESLGVPVIPMIATKGFGLVELKQALSQARLPRPKKRAPMPALIEREAEALAVKLALPHDVAFPEALLLLTLHDRGLEEMAEDDRHIVEATIAAQHRLRDAGVDPVSAPVDARYAWIQSICEAAVTKRAARGLSLSDRLDMILTHRVWGWFGFLAAMGLMFVCIFWVAQKPMDWIDSGFRELERMAFRHAAGERFAQPAHRRHDQRSRRGAHFPSADLILYFFLGSPLRSHLERDMQRTSEQRRALYASRARAAHGQSSISRRSTY
jgi:hypothetical protein